MEDAGQLMRIRLATRPAVLFGAMLVAAVVATFPMRLALELTGFGRAGLTARSATGPIWFSTLREVQFGGVDLGDVHAYLSPVQLLVGRARIDLVGPQPVNGPPPKGAIGVTRHSFGIDDVTANLAAGELLAPLPITKVSLDDVSARFEGGNCVSADGRVTADLGGGIAGISLAQGMTGSAKCEGDALLIPLASASGNERVRLLVRGDGRYRGELIVAASDPDTNARLAATGFQPANDGYRLSVEGRF